jgi:hypothetical protein
MAIYLGSLELATGGAAATGTGLPVNSYAPFYTNGTGSPTGYNATTGLYDHPNGDVWLQTGKTIDDASGNYPDATIGTAANYNTAEGTSGTQYNPSPNGMGGQMFLSQNTTYWYMVNSNSNGGYSNGMTRIQKSNFAQTNFNIRTSSTDNQPSFDVDNTNTMTASADPGSYDSQRSIYIRDLASYTSSFPGTILYTVTVPAWSSGRGVVFGTGTTVWYQNEGNSNMYQYDYTTNTLLGSVSAGMNPSPYGEGYAWSYIGGQYSYLTNRTGIYKIDMVNGGNTLFATFTTQNLSNRGGITPDLNNFTNSIWAKSTGAPWSWEIYNKVGPFVGNSVMQYAGPDFQPIVQFVKIK